MLPQIVPSIRGRIVTAKKPEISVSAKNRNILRTLATNLAEIAALPMQNQRREMWSDLNELKETKPMIWVDEPKAASAKIMRSDSVVESVLYSPPCILDSGIGIQIQERTIEAEQDNEVVSHQHER